MSTKDAAKLIKCYLQSGFFFHTKLIHDHNICLTGLIRYSRLGQYHLDATKCYQKNIMLLLMQQI